MINQVNYALEQAMSLKRGLDHIMAPVRFLMHHLFCGNMVVINSYLQIPRWLL